MLLALSRRRERVALTWAAEHKAYLICTCQTLLLRGYGLLVIYSCTPPKLRASRHHAYEHVHPTAALRVWLQINKCTAHIHWLGPVYSWTLSCHSSWTSGYRTSAQIHTSRCAQAYYIILLLYMYRLLAAIIELPPVVTFYVCLIRFFTRINV